MPVSSPSYFPPNRADGTVVGTTAGTSTTGARNFLALKGAGANSTASDLLIIGDSSATQALSASALQNGVICLGNACLNGTNLADPEGGGIICIGVHSASLASGDFGDNIIIGNHTLEAATLDDTGNTQNGSNTLIGNDILQTFGADPASQINFVVAVGSGALNHVSGLARAVTNVVAVGTGACASTTHGVADCVFVGTFAGGFSGSTPGDVSSLTIVGSQALSATLCGALSQIVAVGDQIAEQAQLSGAAHLTLIGSLCAQSLVNGTYNTVVGSSSDVPARGTNNVILGDNIPSLGNLTSGCIVIGSGAGIGAGLQDQPGLLFVGFDGTAAGAGSGSLFYGLMGAGNLCIGNASATQREFSGRGASNILKLITGTAGNANPVDGGYFYVTGANNSLHWVNSAGTDSTLSDDASLTSLTLSSVADNAITCAGGSTTATATLTAAAPTTGAGQVGLGATTATTASAGANGAPPAQVDSYLIVNVAGTAKKIPLYLA